MVMICSLRSPPFFSTFQLSEKTFGDKLCHGLLLSGISSALDKLCIGPLTNGELLFLTVRPPGRLTNDEARRMYFIRHPYLFFVFHLSASSLVVTSDSFLDQFAVSSLTMTSGPRPTYYLAPERGFGDEQNHNPFVMNLW